MASTKTQFDPLTHHHTVLKDVTAPDRRDFFDRRRYAPFEYRHRDHPVRSLSGTTASNSSEKVVRNVAGSVVNAVRMCGIVNSLDLARKTGMIRDEANDVRDFRLTDMTREMEFEYLIVGDLIAFEPKTKLGRRIAINVQRVRPK